MFSVESRLMHRRLRTSIAEISRIAYAVRILLPCAARAYGAIDEHSAPSLGTSLGSPGVLWNGFRMKYGAWMRLCLVIEKERA